MSKKKSSNLFGAVGKGLKAVGQVASAPFRWAGNQLAKEMQMNQAKDDQARAAGKAANRAFSGLPSNVKIRK